MTIILKNKATLVCDGFVFKCCIGKNGLSKNKIEGDGKTPIGKYSLGDLYYRADRNSKPFTKLKCFKINEKMGWCDDVKYKKYYNKLINTKKKIKYEKLFRRDYKYDLMIPINYNTKKRKIGKGSAIFLHLTKNFKPTLGCVAISRKDFVILLKLINKKTKIMLS